MERPVGDGTLVLIADTYLLSNEAMRTERYRFVVWVGRQDHSKIDAIELYDHEVDPQENQNLAGRPEQAALVARLMTQWKAGWRAAGPKS